MITESKGKKGTTFIVRVNQNYGGSFKTRAEAETKEKEMIASGANKGSYEIILGEIKEMKSLLQQILEKGVNNDTI